MANAGFFSILVIKPCQSFQLCWSRGQVIDTNLTPDSVSEHEELYNDVPPVQRNLVQKAGCLVHRDVIEGSLWEWILTSCENQPASDFIPPYSIL